MNIKTNYWHDMTSPTSYNITTKIWKHKNSTPLEPMTINQGNLIGSHPCSHHHKATSYCQQHYHTKILSFPLHNNTLNLPAITIQPDTSSTLATICTIADSTTPLTTLEHIPDLYTTSGLASMNPRHILATHPPAATPCWSPSDQAPLILPETLLTQLAPLPPSSAQGL